MNAYADTRYIKPAVSFALVDQTAQPDCTPSASSQGELSQLSQVIDEITTSTKKIATLEHNMWVLDSTYDTIETKAGLDTGWISNEISGNDGSINTTLSFSFSRAHKSFGLTIQFDEKADSFPSQFTITFKNSGAVVNTLQITNDSYKTVIQEAINDYDRIDINFTKTSLPHRRVHVLEVTFGIIESFDDNSIISINVMKEISPECNAIPVGEMVMRFDNSNNRYDMINPQGAYRYLKFGMPFKVNIGVGEAPDQMEYAKVGTFYFYQATTENDGMTGTFVAQDFFTYLDNYYVPVSSYTNPMTISRVILIMFQLVGQFDFEIDPNVRDESFATPTESMTCRELLMNACEALRAVAYVSRENVLVIKRIAPEEAKADYTLDRMETIPTIETDSRITKVIVEFNETSAEYEDKEIDEIPQELKFSAALISSAAQGQALARYRLETSRKHKYTIAGRGNPELNVVDTINVYDKYGVPHEAIITQHTLEYNGGLQETIEAIASEVEG